MDAIELEKYEYQLSQIKLALAKDPNNAEYLNLKEELTDLIDLTKQLLESEGVQLPSTSSQRPTTSNSTSSHTPSTNSPATSKSNNNNNNNTPFVPHSLKAGDECQARFSGDGKFYPAKITSVGGADTNRVYSIVFTGYDSTELVEHNDIKPMTENKKRTIQVNEEESEKEKKRKKNEKKADTREVKNAEQGERQQSWQKFAKKSVKKGIVIPGVSGASLFASPADMTPSGRVGVVGSGKGMRTNVVTKRQTFTEGRED